MSQYIAFLNKVSYKYPNASEFALKDLCFKIKKGEFLGVIGPTGSGKTTLCMTFNGIVPQFYGGRFFGHMTVRGFDTLDNPIGLLAQHVGIVFDDPETQITSTTVENEIAFPLENLKVPREEIIERIPHVLEAVRLDGYEKKHPHELSGGQKQRLAIAAAIALQPDILILDEPTSQLDSYGSTEVFSTIRQLNQELGITIVLTSHASEEMAQYTDRIIVLVDGAIKRIASPSQIYSEVEFLQEIYIRPPQVAHTFYLINEYGVKVPEIPIVLEKGIAEISNMQIQTVNNRNSFISQSQNENLRDKPLLSVKDLHHTYTDGTHALKGVSLDVFKGEYLLIIGQNGAGKSTLVKHFVKLLEPTSGQVVVGHKDIMDQMMSSLARKIGYIAQNPDNQIFNTSVIDEVSFALKNLDFDANEIDLRVTESLDEMGLFEKRHQHPLSLPKGDRARVVIAAILAMQPEIIIFDEPTTGQDYQGAMDILRISKKLHKMGKTIIIITHHLYLMPGFAERVIVMGKGTILQDSPIRHAFHQTEVLKSTYIKPPDAVFLAHAISTQHSNLLITPHEVAAYITGNPLHNRVDVECL